MSRPTRKAGAPKSRRERYGAGKPRAKSGSTIVAGPSWVLRCPPGLARLLCSELRHSGLMKREGRADLLWQRNHDLVFLPTLTRAPAPEELRIAEEIHRCLIYGRFKISRSQLERLAAQLRPAGRRWRLAVSVDGSHFNRFDQARFLSRELQRHGLGIDPAASRTLFLFCIEESFYACVAHRGSSEAPGRRAREAERHASLPPPVAAAMAFLARPTGSDVILDPVCGSGTLLAEAAALAPGARLLGSDVDPKAVAAARRNLSHRKDARIETGDARRLDLPERSVTLALANPPFGKQFGDAVENRTLYVELLQEMARVAAPDFRAVVIAGNRELLRTAAREAGFAVARSLPVRVRGEAATISLLRPG